MCGWRQQVAAWGHSQSREWPKLSSPPTVRWIYIRAAELGDRHPCQKRVLRKGELPLGAWQEWCCRAASPKVKGAASLPGASQGSCLTTALLGLYKQRFESGRCFSGFILGFYVGPALGQSSGNFWLRCLGWDLTPASSCYMTLREGSCSVSPVGPHCGPAVPNGGSCLKAAS